MLKAVLVVIKKVGGIQGRLGGGLDLQTEIVTDSHRTIFANDMFQSVSLQNSELFAWVLLACITAFRRWNLSAYHTETTEQNYFHHLFQLATSCCTFIQINCKLFAIFAIFNNVLLILAPLLTLIFMLETHYLYLYISWSCKKKKKNIFLHQKEEGKLQNWFTYFGNNDKHLYYWVSSSV